jgi:hypothetical protein
MKKILLFIILLALGFAGGTIMPNVLADTEESKSAQNCNCGCGQAGTKVMMAPEVSDMLLMTGLIEAFAKDSDGSLSKEELVTVMNTLQKEYYETVDLSVVKGTQSGGSESAKSTVSSYESILNRLFESSKTTNTEVIAQPVQETIVKQSGTSGISMIENQETTESKQALKVKNNNGLGNGSETADNTSIDVKGVDPSNSGKGKTSSKESSTSIVSKKAVITKPGKSYNKKEKVKNNNGLGNGSEPADGTSTDIKGIDPSNPGKSS